MNELIPLARELRHQIPDVMKAFAGLHTAVMAPGALDSKTINCYSSARLYVDDTNHKFNQRLAHYVYNQNNTLLNKKIIKK